MILTAHIGSTLHLYNSIGFYLAYRKLIQFEGTMHSTSVYEWDLPVTSTYGEHTLFNIAQHTLEFPTSELDQTHIKTMKIQLMVAIWCNIMICIHGFLHTIFRKVEPAKIKDEPNPSSGTSGKKDILGDSGKGHK